MSKASRLLQPGDTHHTIVERDDRKQLQSGRVIHCFAYYSEKQRWINRCRLVHSLVEKLKMHS
jgi:hypothetical protein